MVATVAAATRLHSTLCRTRQTCSSAGDSASLLRKCFRYLSLRRVWQTLHCMRGCLLSGPTARRVESRQFERIILQVFVVATFDLLAGFRRCALP
eukprot:3382695-Pleurochrysis_carterae.AAC.1